MPVLDAHPLLWGFQWTQYTPYFNDGDECVFNVYDINAFTGDPEGEYWEESDKILSTTLLADYSRYVEDGTTPNRYPYNDPKALRNWYKNQTAGEHLTNQFKELGHGDAKITELMAAARAADDFIAGLHSLPNDVMQELFGDHVEVTLTRNGAKIEEYSHD